MRTDSKYDKLHAAQSSGVIVRGSELTPKERKKRKKYFAFLFGSLFTFTALEIESHVIALKTKTITPNQWGAQMLGTLQMAHPRAYMLGAQSQGAPVTLQDGIVATRQTLQDQADYLQGFIDDLVNADPRYVEMPKMLEGVVENALPMTETVEEVPTYRADQILNRADLYNERVRGTANAGALSALPPWTELHWMLGPNEDHCGDCPTLAKNGPYRPDTIPTLPGKGQTECLVNCRCRVAIGDTGELIDF